MHKFEELVHRSMRYTLSAIEEADKKVFNDLEQSGSTAAVKSLQMLQLQKVILAIGMFSIFDAILQDKLSAKNGFDEAKQILIQKNEVELHNKFQIFISAINVLKHGRGRSYDFLIDRSKNLPFKIKLRDEDFFLEGDVSAIDTLILVDDKFVLDCAELINQVSRIVES